MRNFEQLETTIGAHFKNKDLLRQALTHRSYLNEHPEVEFGHNERLEFLGDAVLELVVTDYLYLTYPEATEGEMTNWRASLVNSKMLAQLATELDLDSLLYLSRGESKDASSKARGYILANAFEALIGAVYLDQGYAAADAFIAKQLFPKLAGILQDRLDVDPKSRFQELAQEQHKVTPHYQVLEESGPDHAKVFKIAVMLGTKTIATGEGQSKQEAQVDAAKRALETLGWS